MRDENATRLWHALGLGPFWRERAAPFDAPLRAPGDAPSDPDALDWNGLEHATPVDGGPGGWSVALGVNNMPGLSGIDVQSRLKAAHVELPIVFITASDDPAFEQQASDSGSALLRKPFSNETLLQAVGNALEKQSGR